ncbi:Alpha-(1,3)-fucosyltransferase C [Papilio xuthus]|uniref:Fucosyltransferase n=1 Tax=Papilio xuthus TaxID=66420 RepID=A0A194Q4M0_PAPXU|nr:Alpha-(1,3)-fucosyltransferase C [Papilio xuthus]
MEKTCKKNALMFSIKNTLLLLLLVSTVMGFHIWIVCKALSVLGDVTTIIVVNHGKRSLKSWPDDSVYILNWDKHLDLKKHFYGCCTAPKCILTKDKTYFGKDYKYFDAMLFSEKFLESTNRPNANMNMLNIFISLQPENKKIVCDNYYDNFFNLTFTYRLDSDIVWKYFVVLGLNREIIAPSLSPAWNTSLNPVNQEIKSIIQQKTKPVAYIDSNCKLENWTRPYLSKLQKHLDSYSLKIYMNISKKCKKEVDNRISLNEYMFYIIFEDYFVEDYVTRKILQAYDNNAVPIIFGGANYTRFLPPNSYIDGRVTNPSDIAKAINESLNNYTIYEEYFKWTNIYSIVNYQPFCDLCEVLNKPVNKPGKEDFRQWWNGQDMHQCLLPQSKNYTS